jgi:hypothetical protein
MMIVMMEMQRMKLVVHLVFVMEQIVWNVQIITFVFKEVIYAVWEQEDIDEFLRFFLLLNLFFIDGDNDCGDNSDESSIFCRSIQCNTSISRNFNFMKLFLCFLI